MASARVCLEGRALEDLRMRHAGELAGIEEQSEAHSAHDRRPRCGRYPTRKPIALVRNVLPASARRDSDSRGHGGPGLSELERTCRLQTEGERPRVLAAALGHFDERLAA